MHQLTFDTTNASPMAVALTRNDIAHQSVQALLDDVDYVVTSIEPDRRPDAAEAVLAHHDPAVADSLLSTEGRALQAAARQFLAALALDEIRPDALQRLTEPLEPRHRVRSLPTGPTAGSSTHHGTGRTERRPLVGSRLLGVRVLGGGALTAVTAAVSYGVGTLLAHLF